MEAKSLMLEMNQDSLKLKHNKFSDMTPEELHSMLITLSPNKVRNLAVTNMSEGPRNLQNDLTLEMTLETTLETTLEN